jgi:hypothetical protein
MLRVHLIESRANVGAGARGLFADPSNTPRLVDRRSNFAPEATWRRPSDSIKVSCGGGGPGEHRRVGGQGKHPAPRAVVTSIAQTIWFSSHLASENPSADLVMSARRVNSVVSDSFHKCGHEVPPPNPSNTHRLDTKCLRRTHRTHIVWSIAEVISPAQGTCPGQCPSDSLH